MGLLLRVAAIAVGSRRQVRAKDKLRDDGPRFLRPEEYPRCPRLKVRLAHLCPGVTRNVVSGKP